MCLIILAHRAHPDYPLVVAANRDEFHRRPTAAARFWPEQPQLLAGRDLEQGGTWMGMTRSGRFAAVTNFRDPARSAPAPRSRGELTLNYLQGKLAAAYYLDYVANMAGEYAGFNLLLGEGDELWYFSNSESGEPRALEPGLYGLSNAGLNTPWPKVLKGKARLRQALVSRPDHQSLARAVSDRKRAQPQELQLQGLHHEMDQLLSAQFIVNEAYGTRATTTLWRDRHDNVDWREHSFGEDGEQTDQATEHFGLEREIIPPGCE